MSGLEGSLLGRHCLSAINNIRHRKPLPVYGKGENVRDWLYVVDHARAIDMIFHKGKMVSREPGMDGSCYFWGVSEVL